MLKILLLNLLIISSLCNAQQSSEIRGIVQHENEPLESALVEILDSSNERITSGITDAEGKFLIEINSKEKAVFIKVRYYGLKTIKEKIIDLKQPLHLNMKEAEVEDLDSIKIVSEKPIQQRVDRSIFKVNRKDYIKNAEPTEVLNNTPNITYDDQNGIMVENRLQGIIYIDGQESSLQVFKTLDIKEIDKIEVITSPSARYGSEYNGAVINVVTKEIKERYIKGEINGSYGFLRENKSFSPSLSFKSQKLLLRSFYERIDNDQDIRNNISRTSFDEVYEQQSSRDTRIIQEWAGLQSKYNFSERDILYAKLDYSGSSEQASQQGTFSVNSNQESFENLEFSNFKRGGLDLVFDKTIKQNELTLKAKGFLYERNNDFQLQETTNSLSRQTTSLMKEYSGEIDYNLNNKKFLKRNISFLFGSKFIWRNSTAAPNDFDFTQQLSSGFVEFTIDLPAQISAFVSLFYEHTENKDQEQFRKSYNNLLPTLTINKSFKKDINIRYSFSKKIGRPSIYYLNDALVYLNPGVANRGNTALEPQKNQSQQLSFSKKIKSSYLSLNFNYDHIKDAIAFNGIVEDEVLVNFYDNVGEVEQWGGNLSYKTKFFGQINTNFSTGFQKNVFLAENPMNEALKNKGYSFLASLNTSTRILNDKLSFIFYINYRSPLYAFTTTTRRGPYSYLRLSTNILKNRLRVNLTYSDLFNMNAEKRIEYEILGVEQQSTIRNPLSNLSIGLSYNFGKKFSDFIRSKNIKNNDLIDE